MTEPTPSTEDLLITLFTRFRDEGVEYVLVGGQAVRLNGYLRATEDVDVLIKTGRINGEKVIRALDFLKSSADIDPQWFEQPDNGEVENIRVADDLLVDLLFAANGQTFETVQDHVRELTVEGVAIKVLAIDGLLKTKTDYREKDVLDKSVLRRIQQAL